MNDPVIPTRAIAERWTEATRKVESIPINLTRGPSRVIHSVDSGGTGNDITHPFTSTLDGDNVVVQPGTINQLLPSNMFSTLTMGVGNPYYLLLNAGSDGKSVTSATLSLATSLSAPLLPTTSGSAPTAFKVLLAVITGTTPNWTLYQIGLGNITALPKQVLLIPKGSVTPGTEPFDRWWTWAIIQKAV